MAQGEHDLHILREILRLNSMTLQLFFHAICWEKLNEYWESFIRISAELMLSHLDSQHAHPTGTFYFPFIKIHLRIHIRSRVASLDVLSTVHLR